MSYNLTIVPEDQADGVTRAYDMVKAAKVGFFQSYKIVDKDPRIPEGHLGFLTICSITMDGVFQRNGIPTSMAFGGRLDIADNAPVKFLDLIGYRGTTIDPLQLFISAGLTDLTGLVQTGKGTALANVREVPASAESQIHEIAGAMRDCGFEFPVTMGTRVLNLKPDPYRLSIIAFSGMNFVAHAVEKGFSIRTEIGAGNIQFSKFSG